MKNNCIGWFCRLIISTTVIALTACNDDFLLEDNVIHTRPTEYLEFTTSLQSAESSTMSRSTSSHLEIEEEDWCLSMESVHSGPSSRGSLLTLLDGNEAGVIGFSYDSESGPKSPLAPDNNISFTFSHDELSATGNPIRWNSITRDNLDIYAYSPKSVDGLSVNTSDSPTLTYYAPDNIAEHKDIIVSKWSNTPGVDYKGQTIPLNFSHILTAVRLRVGFDCIVKSVEISGVYGSGTYDFASGKWDTEDIPNESAVTEDNEITSDEKISADASYKIEFEGGKSFSAGSALNTAENTMILLPQTLPSGSKISLTIISSNGESTLTAPLESLKWRQGKLIQYTLYEGQPPTIVYFDLAAGNVTINEDSYLGYRFDGSDRVEISDKHNRDNKYYIYQSTPANRYGIYEDGVFTRPEYQTVIASDGQDWRDFIVNNSDVDAVIDEWCDDGKENAATKAGRESTKNRIDIKGHIVCNLTIDNIYSSYMAENPRSRTTAGLSFIPTGSNSSLTINIVGDNRLGAVHYQNNETTNRIVFEGSGSLTVADVDGVKKSTHPAGDYYFGLRPGIDKGYISNHWASVIGGADDQDKENSQGIVINSGRIFAGSTKAENCSAIGGGGNGIGTVTINGGVVTAVATTTGTAIGGGIGFKNGGGKGYVTINGGNVYAYNHANRWNIPSSAIGGAGSNDEWGSVGNVTITDGSVYAQSALGTAIGGGSSYNQWGGNAEITISGGEIIAKTLSPISASIGGGTAYTRGAENYDIKARVLRSNFNEDNWKNYGTIGHTERWSNSENIRNDCKNGDYFIVYGTATDTGNSHELIYKSDNDSGDLHGECVAHTSSADNKSQIYDGGHATIRISGSPIIRTGSIGGGGTGDSRGHIGNADINVTGGDIQAQFILAAGTTSSVTPTFTMTGGTIRNSNTSDTEYLHVHQYGGAVYLEDGVVNINGGTITKCSAEYGGAVYIKGTSNSRFNMTAGNIIKNSSTIDGGAIYMESGSVVLTGGSINENLTIAGNGGGVYINGGNLDIPYGTVQMRQNSAQEELRDNVLVGGYGGAIYITSSTAPVKANIAAGTIYGNTSDNKGGGICVDMNTSDLLADVIIGTNNGVDDSPMITRNSTLMQGGGLYARGANAHITINSGSIINNQVSQYVTNEDVTNELGSVTLNGGNVTHNVITFYANNGKTPEETATQNIVTSTNSTLVAPTTFTRTGYRLVGWNTRPGGNGTNYSNGQIMNISNNIRLYARWAPIVQ